ncbi:MULTISPECIES: TolC family protein [Chitinophagaceae]
MRKIVGVLRLSVCLLGLLISHESVSAQVNSASDSVALTIDSADSKFIAKNLSLLAQRYNIDVQKAQVIQAKLYPNPNISVAQLAYNKNSKSVLPFGSNGEFTSQISQLILLAGKRNKSVKLAQANVTLSEVQFSDLIRTLKYTLHSDFYNLYYLQKSSKVYGDEISSLQKVVDAFKTQVTQGNISQKEYVRVKAQLYSLLSEYSELVNQMNDIQSEMRLLMLEPSKNAFVPTVEEQAVIAYKPDAYSLETLVDSAFQNRTDLKMAKINTDISKLNLSYQKSLATPDLTASANYDQQGGYINHQVQIGVAMDLPFFNRNQGNIKAARTSIDISKVNEDNTQATVQENVYRALQKAYDMDKMYKSVDTSFANDFQKLQEQVLANYQKRNIGLLDFLDFYDSYKQNVLQMNQVLYNKVQSFEDINYYTATNFFK